MSFPTGPKPSPETIPYTLNGFQKIKIGYVSKWESVPRPWLEYFDAHVCPRLDSDVKDCIIGKFGREEILRLVRYRMFGQKHRGNIEMNATILIGSASKCEKVIKQTLSLSDLAYLKRFDQPWRVYQLDIRYGAFSDRSSEHTLQNSSPVAASEPFTGKVYIEKPDGDRFENGTMIRLGEALENPRYATLGGLISLGADLCGITTGHSFVAHSTILEHPVSTDMADHNTDDSHSSASGQEADSDSFQASESQDESAHPPAARHWRSPVFSPFAFPSHEGVGYSFLGQKKSLGPSTHRLSSAQSDWALVLLPKRLRFRNSYTVEGTRFRILSLMPKSDLRPGPVHILCGTRNPLSGFLMAGSSHIQSGFGTLTVLDIVMEADPLPYGFSGSWVVREEWLLGHLVASSNSGMDCFMLPLEDIFDDIRDATGTTPHLAEYEPPFQWPSLPGIEVSQPYQTNMEAWLNTFGDALDTRLQAASKGGHEKVVQILLERGAEVNAKGGPWGSALQAASVDGHEKVVQILLEKGAEVNAKGEPCGSALQAASAGGHEKVVQILLEKGAEVNTEDGYYGSALQAASAGRHEKVVQILLEKGAKVNAEGGYYGSALRAASKGGHEEIVQMLLNAGADQGGLVDDNVNEFEEDEEDEENADEDEDFK